MNKLTSVLCLLLCICMLIGSSPLPCVYAQSDVIRIANLADFLEFAQKCRLDSFSKDKTFQLTADIDLTGTDFDGIPIFCGNFDGGEHTITGLSITSSGSAKGLFRYLASTATVRNLNVEGTVIPSASRSQVGGIAGSNAGLIENCSFSGTVVGADNIGGITGLNLPVGVIRNCNTAGVVSGKHFAGGIAGSNNGTVQNCENRSDINTTAQQNDITISDVTLDSLLNVESTVATTDLGGIAGISSGIIIGCVNQGNVGYPHMGYNVGGVVGLQVGYLASCENYGAVSGRKEVGGIVGQQEPQVVLNYSTDTLQILQSQITVLSDLVERAVINGNSNATHIRNLLYKLERQALDAQDALDYLKASAENPSLEDLQTYADAIETIRSSMEGITQTLRSLRNAMDNTMTDLDKDMAAISEQIAQIESTLNDADANLGGEIFDISDQDTADQLGSKLENCINFGSISGDFNVGGILGAISFENDLDPEEDITIVGEVTLNAVGSLRSVILGCSNLGAVSTKYQRSGGIIGWLTMGLVKDCVNTGAVGGETVDFAGGIAGESLGYIRNCKVKAEVSGDAQIGGIAGRGSIASDCYAMVLLHGKERLGGIFGVAAQPYHDLESPIHKNYYYVHGADIGGIDGVSYEDQAKGLSLEIFLILREDDAFFHRVTITFLADGEVVQQSELPTGSTFQAVPDVPQKVGCIGAWCGLADLDLNELVFDLNIHAEYTPYTNTIQSQVVTETGRPVLLLQGDFITDASVSMVGLEHSSDLGSEKSFIQGWEFTVQGAVGLETGRLLIPEETKPDMITLLVRDVNGNWSERSFRMDESYLVFSLSSGEDAIALVKQPSAGLFRTEIIVAVAAVFLTVLCIVIFCVKIRKKKRTQMKNNAT